MAGSSILRRSRRIFVRAAPAFAPLALAACGGGGGGGGGSATGLGLSVPSQMSVVTPSSNVTTQGVRMQAPAFGGSTDYDLDLTRTNVYDPAIEPIQTVNEILCLLGQTRYDAMVNQGDYNAQIDENLCGDDSGGGGSGQSSSSQAIAPEIWVVNSMRADLFSPEIVHFWVPQSDDGPPSTIRARLGVDAGVSAANPFGTFTMNFAGVDDAAPDVNNPVMHGTLATLDASGGALGFSLFFSKGDTTVAPALNSHAELTKGAVTMSTDQSTGSARVHVDRRENNGGVDSGLLTDDFLLAFNAQHLLRQRIGSAPQAFLRDTVHESVFQYNLYEASGPNAGQRVELDTGFSFFTQSGEYGWIGYWGLWTPPGVTVTNGQVVSRQDFGSSTTTPYTMLVAPGKLIHFVQNQLDLVDLGGTTFEFYDFSQFGQPPARYQVVYQNGEFEEIALFDDPSQSWQTLGSPVAIDTSALGALRMFSQSLGGDVFYKDGDAFITYFKQSFVNGEDAIFAGGATVDFYGYVQCLRSGILGSEADVGDVYLADSNNVAQPYHFRFAADALVLELDVNGDGSLWQPVGLANGETISTGPFNWGMRTGPLVLDTTGLTSPFDVFGASDFYAWETGSNPWNQFATAVDSMGHQAVFDAPIQFSYTHAQPNDRNHDASHAGETFLLGYGGRGQLWGIPSSEVDLDNDGSPDRFYPEFSLADGVLLGPTGMEYVVKAIEVEQTLVVDPLGAPELDLLGAAALTLPDGSAYVTPDNGAKPVVTDPPAVIAGELQGALATLDQ